MKTHSKACLVATAFIAYGWARSMSVAEGEGVLPHGTRAVWDLGAAHREVSATRERICINGLWRWQPAGNGASVVPTDGWGYFKVPGAWPGIGNWLQKDSQTVHVHPRWNDVKMSDIASAWYERDITVPREWFSRRIALAADYVNSCAIVFIDGKHVGTLAFPGGELDLTSACQPGSRHALSLRVVAMPLKETMLSFTDSNAARGVKGSVARRGLCGDVYLTGTPSGPRLSHVRINTSVRKGAITVGADLARLAANTSYVLRARIADGAGRAAAFESQPFTATDLTDGRASFTERWMPDRLWDIHTPGNLFHATVSLVGPPSTVLDTSLPVRFGFREFWIDGRDFYLNGTRLFVSAIPFDNAQIGAAASTYEAALETMKRMRSFGINFVYTHNYNCTPGAHMGFAEILRAADDAGMLFALSQPHFGQYEWQARGADAENGYAEHAAFYARVAGNHPSVVAYSTSHNACGYADDMNPHMIDGTQTPRSPWSRANAEKASRAEAIIRAADPSRIVYHHSSGNLGSMHTINFYPNFVPIQEMSDWFEHWATAGVKPVFTVEYAAPFPWDFAMYRGWYRGKREFGSAVVPWELCLAEWNAQFFGDQAYAISEVEKACLRWEAQQFRAGQLWHRWDYPHEMGSREFDEQYPVMGLYLADNWRAFRTWGLSANSPWSHGVCWKPRAGIDRGRRELPTDWDNLQQPGFSADYIEDRYENMVTAFAFEDWVPTVAAEALLRNNMPLLAYIAGETGRFTSKDHIFHPGDTVKKQLIVINNSRETVSCNATWAFGLPQPRTGAAQLTLTTGQQRRLPLRFELPDALTPGRYTLRMATDFSTGEKQEDTFAIRIIPRPDDPEPTARIALFDPGGETGALLRGTGVRCTPVRGGDDVSSFDILVIGRGALTVNGPCPDVSRVPDGLKVIVFEQTADALEKRLGFRVARYGLRNVFKRVPDHPMLAGLDTDLLRDWRGEATLLPPKLAYDHRPGEVPHVTWCGIDVKRLWRAGCRGNVGSVLIEKPARGDFMPILDGGYSLQYTPLLAYREGKGLIVFCQADVTARTEAEPAADTLVRNIMRYVAEAKPRPRRDMLYVGTPAGKHHLVFSGFSPRPYAGGALSPDHVLVVGRGGETVLARNKPHVARFLRTGGHLLCLGLDEGQANAFLPWTVHMTRAEHIASTFGAPEAGSLLAGVGSPDMHNRDPCELPLVTGGATVVGNGILATARDTNVVFYQLPPYELTTAQGGMSSFKVASQAGVGQEAGKPRSPSDRVNRNLRRTYRRSSFALNRLLGSMGACATTPLLTYLSAPPGSEGNDQGVQLIANGDFSVDGDHDGTADRWGCSLTGAGTACEREEIAPESGTWCQRLSCARPDNKGKSGTMLYQLGIPVTKDQWYRISFKAKAEGMDGTAITMAISQTERWRSLLEYQPFIPETDWKLFTFLVKGKETENKNTRFQIWHSRPGTVWYADMRMHPVNPPTEGRWMESYYADVPEDWDDPYRFFRW